MCAAASSVVSLGNLVQEEDELVVGRGRRLIFRSTRLRSQAEQCEISVFIFKPSTLEARLVGGVALWLRNATVMCGCWYAKSMLPPFCSQTSQTDRVDFSLLMTPPWAAGFCCVVRITAGGNSLHLAHPHMHNCLLPGRCMCATSVHLPTPDPVQGLYVCAPAPKLDVLIFIVLMRSEVLNTVLCLWGVQEDHVHVSLG